MGRILGLDLGSNSVGWALISTEKDNENGKISCCKIENLGSRIIPMDAAILGDYDKGNSVSQTKDRTFARGVRRLYERAKLRRERLHRVLSILGFLPTHYEESLTRYGKFANDTECKLAWKPMENGGYEFLFKDSFEEMLADFRERQPELLANGKKIPYDWTIYYLRKKALTEKISKEELAWILLNFNQKRGYNQLRGEEEETGKTAKTRQYFEKQVVTDIIDTGEVYKGLKIFNVHLKNGLVGKVFKPEMPLWKDKEKTIIVTIDTKDGEDKYNDDGTLSCRFQIPTEEEWDSKWALVKMKTQQDLEESKQTIGQYIYESILSDPSQKIIGKLVRVVDRHYYVDELRTIMETQQKYHPELQDRDLYAECVSELYTSNENYRNSISGRDFVYLFVDDIIFYQRPLKSKKSLIADCPYESVKYIKDGKETQVPLKCIAKSHPLFQEFRLWQFLSNLKIYQKEKHDIFSGGFKTDVDVTNEFITCESDYVKLFDWLNDKNNIEQKNFLAYTGFKLKKDNISKYRWNYVEDKSYPCNETRAQMLASLNKAGVDSSFLTKEKEEALWHILYSIDDKTELRKALAKFAEKNSLCERFVEVFQKTKPFEKEYGAYSAKAIKKLLSLMRRGYYWKQEAIDNNTAERIEKIITGEADDAIRERAREKAKDLKDIIDFKGLPLWLACYVVYDIHSESKDSYKWETPEDIDTYLKSFKQHSLRNPIVEKVVMETLRTVRDIWKEYGKIDEIHIEMGRNMKQTAAQRKADTIRNLENENTNLRIKTLLMELANPRYDVENVRPFSPSQQDLLRIYEEGVFDYVSDVPDDIKEIKSKLSQTDKTKKPSSSDVMRYKCWLEQKYQSPYTGSIIPLSKLFTPAYEIEHVIPRSRYFDDSFNNKVICESEVNKLKDNMLGLEFIKNNQGRIVQLSLGKTVKIFSAPEYEEFVKEHYSKNQRKMKNLLLEDIPDEFIGRQLNDSRYISKFVRTLLSNIVKEEGEQEAISKNIVTCTGGITDRLKKDWGINDVWNKIILPRFERMNKITESEMYTSLTTNGHIVPAMPLELQKGFNKKRIDHRHHAMDAIVIACADRNMINYLNNESASKNAKISRVDLRNMLCSKKVTDTDGNYAWIINKPWNTFTQDCYEALTNTIVSFKQNLRVINKTTNHYQRFGKDGKKIYVSQEKGDSWAIRKSMHKETFYGEVNLRKTKAVSLNEAIKNPKRIVERDLKKKIVAMLALGYDAKKIKTYFEEHKDTWNDINLSKIEVYYFTKETNDRYFAVRKMIDTSFDDKFIKEKVTDTGVRKIMLAHLVAHGGNPKEAFSPEGIENMNANIKALNGGKSHQPIYKVRTYEKADKFSVGENGNKESKFVEAAKGTNLFFAIYENEVFDKKTGETIIRRTYDTIPLNIVIERQKAGLSSAPDKDGISPKYVISPNDLVYLPTAEEIKLGKLSIPLDKERIYKMVSASTSQCFFIKSDVASSIVDKIEFSSLNKMERSITSEMIKETCIPIKVDRLGKVIQIGNEKI